MEKKCRKCKRTFDCKACEDCWCFSIKVSGEQLKNLQDYDNDCLCETCLLSVGATKQPRISFS